MKKRIIAGFLTIAMLIALAACGGQKTSEPTKEAETEALRRKYLIPQEQ